MALFLTLLSVGTWCSHAAADDAEARAAATYARGKALYSESKWEEAARAFAEADAIAPNDAVLEAALEAAMRADTPALAMSLVERAARLPLDKPSGAALRAHERFSTRAALIVAPCVVAPSPCRVRVDGTTLSARRSWFEPGEHTIELGWDATAPGRRTLAAGSTTNLVPTVARETVGALPSSPDDEGARADTGTSPWWLLVPGGLTVAFGGVAAVSALQVSSIEDDLAAYQVDERPLPTATANERRAYEDGQRALLDDGATWSTTANVFIGLAAAAAASTIVMGLFVVDWGGDGDAPTTAIATPNGRGGADVCILGTF